MEAARAVVAGAQRQLVVGGQLLHVFADLLDQLDVNLATDVQQACGKASAHTYSCEGHVAMSGFQICDDISRMKCDNVA